jgi:hypothetical protein
VTSFGVVHPHLGGPLLAPGGPDPCCFARQGSLSEALQKSGFVEIEEEMKTVAWTWPGLPEQVWELEQAVGAPFNPLLKRVPKEQWPETNSRSPRCHPKIRSCRRDSLRRNHWVGVGQEIIAWRDIPCARSRSCAIVPFVIKSCS